MTSLRVTSFEFPQVEVLLSLPPPHGPMTTERVVWLSQDNHLIKLVTKNKQNANSQTNEVGFFVGCKIQQRIPSQLVFLILSAVQVTEV
jgi:hypothetical protein